MNEQYRFEELARTAWRTDDDCPNPDQLAAFVLGMLTGNEQLIVAAHVRTCPLCAYDVSISRPPEPHPRLAIARWVPLPLLEGHRSAQLAGLADRYTRRYEGAAIIIDVTIAPPDGEVWRITGQIRRYEEPLVERTVVLRSKRRRFVQTSDSEGFFAFLDVLEGRYTITIADGATQVQIRGLELTINQ